MSLSALRDLFARHRAGATGHWRLGQEPNRTIYLEQGAVVFAASSHPLDRLTHLLVERGKLTQVQLDYAMANLNPTMSIGRNLIEMGFITQRDLLDVARAQVERVVWAALAEAAETPVFEARALDAATVRLPFDTPAMLLSGVLGLQDRERVLAELGPLDQQVTLEVPLPQGLILPSDLVRLPALMDGQHALVELSRESGVEPFRLGAFVLYLREMGWADLRPVPRPGGALLLPLLEPTAAPTPLALPVPPPPAPVQPPIPAPSLIEAIEASQIPTTNLDHLSEALDQLGPEDEIDLPARGGQQAPLPAERPLPIQQIAAGTTELPEVPDLDPPRPSRRPWILVLLLLAALGLWGGLRWYKRNPVILPRLAGSIRPNPAPGVQPAPPTAPMASSQAPVPTPAKPTAPAEAKATPEPEPKRAVDPAPAPRATSPASPKAPAKSALPTRAERLKAIQAGDWKLALSQGAALRTSLQGKWTLRLEVACQGDTIQRAANLLKKQDPDLFLLPMTMRTGRTCHQVFLGSYDSEAAALTAAKRLPLPFLAEGNRPKPFRVDQIPSRQ